MTLKGWISSEWVRRKVVRVGLLGLISGTTLGGTIGLILGISLGRKLGPQPPGDGHEPAAQKIY